MSYRLLNRGVLRLSDNVIITRDMLEWEEYRAWLAQGNTALPMIVTPPPETSLAEVKLRRIRAVSEEALIHIQTVMPEVSDMATAMLVRELWLSIAPAARQPTPDMSATLAIFVAWRVAVVQVKQCATVACVDAIVAAWP